MITIAIARLLWGFDIRRAKGDRVEVDEAEPVVLLETRALAGPQGPVGIHGYAIATKDEHASKAGRGPVVGGSAKGRVVDASGYGCNHLAVRRNVVENGPSVFVGEGGNGGGRGLRVWVRHGSIVRRSSSKM